MSEINEIKMICTELSNANKKYVIAVAQALKFSQAQGKDKMMECADYQSEQPQKTA